MRLNMKKMYRGIKNTAVKRSPELLTGLGIAGMITTTFLAVKATPKALMLIEEEKRQINYDILEEAKKNEKEIPPKIDHLEPIDVVKTTWKCYIPAIVTGSISVVCLIGASSVHVRRNAALATAYTLSETALRDYQKKVVETIGEQKEQVVRDAVAKEQLERNPVTNKEVFITPKGETLCYDAISGRYFKSDIDAIKRAVNDLDRRLMDEMFISLNEFYYEIGLDQIKLGDDLGWNIDRDRVRLRYSSQLAADDTPCLVIDYEYAPRYDFRTLM